LQLSNESLDLPTLNNGAVAQLVEQWTENPCVGGSIPLSTTALNSLDSFLRSFLFFTAFNSTDGLLFFLHIATSNFTIHKAEYLKIEPLPII
jgi:hypothetical protein